MVKDSPRSTAGELQKIVESRGQKTFQTNCQTAPTSSHVWEDLKYCFPNSSKNKHDWNFKWDWLLWSDEIKKIAF